MIAPRERHPLAGELAGLLKSAVGASRGITIANLQKALWLASRRDAEDTCEHAVEDLGFVVVAGNTGYYRPTVGCEIDRYEAALRSRIRRMARRLAITRRQALAEGWRKENGRWVRPAAQLELIPHERTTCEADSPACHG